MSEKKAKTAALALGQKPAPPKPIKVKIKNPNTGEEQVVNVWGKETMEVVAAVQGGLKSLYPQADDQDNLAA